MTDEDSMRTIVRETVKETLATLGFNVEKPDELRADMAFVRNARGNVDNMVKAAGWAFVAAFVGGIGTAVTYGVKAWLGS